MPASRTAAAALLAALAWASHAPAQDAPKDDKDAAIERLLEKIDGKKDELKKDEPAKKGDEGNKEEAKKDEPKKDEPKKDAEPEDKGLDNLLKKIGESDPEPRPAPRPPGEASEPPPAPDGPAGTKLDRDEQEFDDHLRDILGRKRKPKDQPPQGGGGGGGQSKLDEAVEKMRQVERRLSKTDTGEETRKTQDQIVQDLDTLLKQLRQQSGQGRGQRMRGVRQAGNQQGNQPQDQPGTDPGGVGPMAPKTPAKLSDAVGVGSEWGHLPPELRTELENVFKEMALPNREEMIKRYYMTVNKKGRARPE